MRHLAIFLPSLRGGGAERVMVQLANGLAARGYRIDLVLVQAKGPYLGEVASGVKIVDLGRSRVLAGLWPLMGYLRRERPDAMLSALVHANIVAIWAKLLARVQVRLVVSERNSLTALTRSRSGKVLHWLMQRFYSRSDGVIAVSQGIERELVTQVGLPPARVISIPNPVDVTRILQQAAAPEPHPWLVEGEEPVILAIGRLEEQKDYPTLLAAFEQLRRKRPARLIILGEGRQRAGLEQQIEAAGLTEVVALPGFDANPYAWLARCRVYVLGSRFEGFPNSLVQALACGAGVVSTDCPTGPDEILEGGRWGRLVPVGDAAAMAAALAAALDEVETEAGRAAAQARGRAAIERYKVDAVLDRYQEFLLTGSR